MRTLSFSRVALLCGLLTIGGIVSCKSKSAGGLSASSEGLSAMRQVAQRFIDFQTGKLTEQLSAFTKVVMADRDFSMKLLVEHNRSAPEVTDFTQRYMEPMGLTMLDITDSQRVLLSCGQFPASAGTSVTEKASRLSEKPAFLGDMVKGQMALTLQSRVRFTILDSVFYCSGGFVVDQRFVESLPLAQGFTAFIRQGSSAIGNGGMGRVSACTDSTVTISDTMFRASAVALPCSGRGEAAVLVIVDQRYALKKP